MTSEDQAFLDWLASPAGRELTSTRKGMVLVSELAIDAVAAVKREQPGSAYPGKQAEQPSKCLVCKTSELTNGRTTYCQACGTVALMNGEA